MPYRDLIAWSSLEVVPAPYADLTNANGAAVAIDEPVFLTSGSYAASFLTTEISFVSEGREVGIAWVFACGCDWVAAGGRFVGLLELVLTTLSRSCDIAALVKDTAANVRHTERRTNFVENIKLKTPWIFSEGF
jgi:hypothetical protein